MAAPGTCALCKQTDTNDITGKLLEIPDADIVAHFNCMIYSPAVTTTVSQEYSQDSQEDSERFHFDVKSVQKEIKRGKNLRCTLCKRNGATVGCDIKTCKRNYHYPCVIKAKGSPSRYKYVVYCAVHKNKKNNGTKDFENAKKCMQRRGKKKKLQNMAAKRRKNNIKKPLNNEVTSNEQVNEPSECSFILPIHTIETEDYEGQIDKIKQFWSPTCYRRDDIEHEPVPSTSAQCMSSGTSSEESVSLLSPQVKKVFSLSGLPKRKKKHASKSTPSKELTEVLQGMSSQERKDLSQIYSELGGSYQDPAIEMDSTSENQNVTESAEDTLTTDVTDVSTSSSNDEIDKTPETLPDINVHGTFTRQLKSILPQIKITLDSPKRNLTKNTEQKDGHAISAESPHSSTDDQSSTRPRNDLCKPLENQERTGGLIEENDQVPLESSESDTSKRKRSQDLEELMPNMKRQQTERPEQLEIFEDQTEYHLRENVTSESECASEHHSGPSRMTPPLRRLSFDSSCQNERVDDLDDIDGFGRAVAGQCRLLLQEKQTKYMSYVLAAADLFRRHSTLPELDILITNLRTVLEKSQTSTHCSSCGSSV
ncbi:PHD finger protein 11 isoform X5 [Dendropsophus ebraccatus]|uniref:PHD finger protein 11 isoform X5 n=1 Tax=Dendropsophus ebraccatus TaxID=150705 RepID=UPI003831B5F2